MIHVEDVKECIHIAHVLLVDAKDFKGLVKLNPRDDTIMIRVPLTKEVTQPRMVCSEQGTQLVVKRHARCHVNVRTAERLGEPIGRRLPNGEALLRR